MTNATHSVREARRLAESAAAVVRDDTSFNTSATQVLLDLTRAVTELAGAVEELARGGVAPNGAPAAGDSDG
ncbi:hypothetical protein [Nocardioides sp. LHG3406-4]|uniref:hypothetical protein n=1 Tax=Nocardioides sp. LHG3406-4 TaxID=2804575 RepID=UPI003CF147B6